ncbi:MAG: NAD(P)/FAD-dependent oxidoreductase [Fimbriimonadales bacterium]
MSSTTLILGGGFGGLTVANTLRKLLPPAHQIILVDEKLAFVLGATKTWVALGDMELKDAVHSRNRLRAKGIEFVNAHITGIDPLERRVVTDKGDFRGDHLVVALGADVSMNGIPGLAEAAETFYTVEGAVRLRKVLRDFRGGSVMLLIPKGPFKCPPAPYEGAMLVNDHFKRRGIEAKVDVYTVEGLPMATAGPEIGQYVVQKMAERNIGFFNQVKTMRVKPHEKMAEFEGRDPVGYDLLLTVPPHAAPKVVVESGLAKAGAWIPADPGNLAVAGFENVYAIGDVSTVPLPGEFKPGVKLVMPKAGIFAQHQGEVVAHHIAAAATGDPSDVKLGGTGFCYIELGDQHAVRGDGSFFDTPHPTMAPPAVPDRTQYEQKKAWVDSWIRDRL